MARHTFGTMLVSEGICLESIAKMMGHSSVKSTQVYAKITDDNISRDMDRLQKRREAKGLTTSDTTAEHNKALLQKKLDRPKELLREDPRLAVSEESRTSQEEPIVSHSKRLTVYDKHFNDSQGCL